MNISAIIPAYNSARYIDESISSIMTQTYSPLEIIIVDDGSEDETVLLVESWIQKVGSDRIRLIKQPTNGGVSKARNLGILEASGDWILFMDADDWFDSKHVEKLMQRITELNSIQLDAYILAHSAYRQVDELGFEIGIMRSKQVEPSEILGYELVRNEIVTPSGVMVSKKQFLDVGGFNEKRAYSEDWDLWLRLAKMGGFAYNDEATVNVRRHSGNASGAMSKMHNAEKEILASWSQTEIKNAIYRRKLSYEHNKVDYVSILYRLDRYEEGFQELTEVSNDTPAISFYRGIYYLERNLWSDAERAFGKVLLLEPNHGAALNNAGALCLLKGEYYLANRFFASALIYYPGYIDAINNQGLAKEGISGKDLVERIRWTRRELRKTLLRYQNC